MLGCETDGHVHVCSKYLTLIHPPTIMGLVKHTLCKINNRRSFEIILPPYSTSERYNITHHSFFPRRIRRGWYADYGTNDPGSIPGRITFFFFSVMHHLLWIVHCLWPSSQFNTVIIWTTFVNPPARRCTDPLFAPDNIVLFLSWHDELLRDL
jgi:hypothetical protein